MPPSCPDVQAGPRQSGQSPLGEATQFGALKPHRDLRDTIALIRDPVLAAFAGDCGGAADAQHDHRADADRWTAPARAGPAGAQASDSGCAAGECAQRLPAIRSAREADRMAATPSSGRVAAQLAGAKAGRKCRTSPQTENRRARAASQETRFHSRPSALTLWACSENRCSQRRDQAGLWDRKIHNGSIRAPPMDLAHAWKKGIFIPGFQPGRD